MNDRLFKTRERILKTAYELFSTFGYDNTPINRILERAAISKGGFYHHFKSKEEIIDILAKMHVDQIVKIIQGISDEKDITAVEKFDKLIEQVQLFREENRDQLYKMFETFLKNENLMLKDKIDSYALKMVLPS